MSEIENEAKLGDVSVDRGESVKIPVKGKVEEIEGVNDKNKVSNMEKTGLVKERSDEEHGRKITLRVEVAHEIVEKELIDQNNRELRSHNFRVKIRKNSLLRRQLLKKVITKSMKFRKARKVME